MKAFFRDFKLGIIGGGQLGRMLLQACPNFNLYTCVLDPSEDGPCKGLANEYTQGSLQDYQTVYAFGKQADLLTIEIENVNIDALYQLEREGVEIYPQPRVIEIIQDKRTQKQFYLEQGIPTAEFIMVKNREDVKAHANFFPAFNKLGKGGYDGGGVVSLKTVNDIERAFDDPGLLEKTVDVDTEISVIAARSSLGEIRIFPPVECVFNPDFNLVDYLIAPSSLPKDIQQTAETLARKIAQSLSIVGLLAVEMFVTKEGEILVNEVAPRPHNSGHQTINANDTSQYEQHLRAILGLPLGSTKINTPSAMVNLLGEEGYTGPAIYHGLDKLLEIEGSNIFLYGKEITKPHRKMGHVTILNDDTEALKKRVRLVKKVIKVIS
ncbi:MAG: 5-(carboxyamino)imidazole ribonucleotide synthase [Gammaproteobacteria bacterium]|nr:5-(carboxyamino)imidazole ribonucleotide synthase [Gammaproteobacteria bacterium]